jgi:hypothetical protein
MAAHQTPGRLAQPGSDVVKEYDTSVVTNRTMDKIAKEATAVWNSNAK